MLDSGWQEALNLAPRRVLSAQVRGLRKGVGVSLGFSLATNRSVALNWTARQGGLWRNRWVSSRSQPASETRLPVVSSGPRQPPIETTVPLESTRHRHLRIHSRRHAGTDSRSTAGRAMPACTTGPVRGLPPFRRRAAPLHNPERQPWIRHAATLASETTKGRGLVWDRAPLRLEFRPDERLPQIVR